MAEAFLVGGPTQTRVFAPMLFSDTTNLWAPWARSLHGPP